LVLGKSETVGSASALFFQPHKKVKIFSVRKDSAVPAVTEIYPRVSDKKSRTPLTVSNKGSQASQQSLDKLIDNVFLTKLVPPSVVINSDLDIVQFRGETSLFLNPAPGRASLNLLKMLRPGLSLELRNAVSEVGKTGKPVKKSSFVSDGPKSGSHIFMEVIPLKLPEHDPLLLVTFRLTDPAPVPHTTTQPSDQRIQQLESELMLLREEMRTFVHENE